MTEDLYTIKDVKRVRDLLTEEQENRCAITGLEIPPKQHCLEHAHDANQYVRGVAHRQANAALGKIENLYVRYLRYWYPGKLSDFLRQCAAYLEQESDSRFRHPGHIKKICTMFNSLTEKQKETILQSMHETGSNSKQRKELFKKLVLSRLYSYEFLKESIINLKEQDATAKSTKED